MNSRTSNSNRLISNIDVTALCAVLFVIAIIMVFVTSKPFHGWSVDLPRVNHASILRGAIRDDALIITVERDSSVFFGGDRAYPDELPAKIRDGLARGSERKIYIRADARARYSSVEDVLDKVRSTGIENIAFICNQHSSLPSMSNSITPLPTQ